MTDTTGLPGTPDDEIVSAVLDGEATAAENALVAADPALTARLEVFRSVSGAVATPVDPPAGARDGAVAAALALHDSLDQPDQPEGAERPASVTPLASRRSTGRTLSIAAAVVAAVVLPLMAIAAFNSSGDDQSDQETATDAIAPTDDDGAGVSDGVGASSTTAPTPTPTDAVGGDEPATDLGSINDVQTLAAVTATAKATSEASARAEAVTPETPTESGSDIPSAEDPATTTAPTSAPQQFDAVVGDDPCEVEARAAQQGLDQLVYTATVTYRGTPAWVHVFRTVDGSFEVAVVSATADCTTLATVRL